MTRYHGNSGRAILRATCDGDDLAPQHLALLQEAVNCHLSEKGQAAFQELVESVRNDYTRLWFHGIEHVTIDHERYESWRGKGNREMDFLGAIRLAQTGRYMRRPSWENRVIMYIHSATVEDGMGKYRRKSLGASYIATCHVTTCELGGVRTVDDILAEDWELY